MRFTPFYQTRDALRGYRYFQRMRVFGLCGDFEAPPGYENALISLWENAVQNVCDACGDDDRAWKWIGAIDRMLVAKYNRERS